MPDGAEDQVAVTQGPIGVLHVPREERGFLAAVSEGEHLAAVLWQELVQSGRDHGVRTVRSMHDFLHGVANASPLICTRLAFRELIRMIGSRPALPNSNRRLAAARERMRRS